MENIYITNFQWHKSEEGLPAEEGVYLVRNVEAIHGVGTTYDFNIVSIANGKMKPSFRNVDIWANLNDNACFDSEKLNNSDGMNELKMYQLYVNNFCYYEYNQWREKIYQTFFKPEINQEYWFIYDRGTIDSDIWKDSEVDYFRYYMGNVFESNQKAKFAIKRSETISKLKEYVSASKQILNWEDNEKKYVLSYNPTLKEIEVLETKNCFNEVYFSDYNVAEKAIKKIGEKELKKYYFQIEE